MLREMAEARMVMGRGFPDEFVSILRMQAAPLSKNGKFLALARIQKKLALPVAAHQMRRLFGPHGNAARQDVYRAARAATRRVNVLLAADSDTVSRQEDYAAWAAFRKAKRRGRRRGEVRIAAKQEGEKIRGRAAL